MLLPQFKQIATSEGRIMNSPEWNSEEGIPKSKKEHEEEVGTMGQYLAMQWPLAVSFGLAAWFHSVRC